MSHLMNTYTRLPVAFVRGEGVWLWDGQNKRYLDAVAGIGVNGLGHAHPKLVKALAEQVLTLIHTSNLYQVQKQEELAARLADLAHMDKVFFCTSGAEANEAAIKLARLYGHQKGIDNPTIIVMEKSFHGRTMATLSATGSRRVQAGFEPLMGGFARVPYNDVDAVAQVASHNKNIVAVLVEPIQGEAGIRMPLPLPAYLQGLRRVCDEHGWLLMLDEVQSGIGRTGKWFAHQHSGITPNVMTLAKGLGSGVPIGACLAAGQAADVFKPGNHGSTFGGSPLACTAALTTLAVIEEENLMPHAVKLGEFIRNGFAEKLAGAKDVVQIRGEGLMIGIELAQPCGDLVKLALEQGLLINVTAENVIRLLPSLVMREAEAQQLIDILSGLIQQFVEPGAAAHQARA
ncbi:MAG TPA: aspartate aminotransferase family protein [Burkholderiales bacterium]|nr:aspartate aminotransferase family protein [Burkholderiales bacterium]